MTLASPTSRDAHGAANDALSLAEVLVGQISDVVDAVTRMTKPATSECIDAIQQHIELLREDINI